MFSTERAETMLVGAWMRSAPGEFRHPDPLIKSQLLCL